jgi:hypothetical protein
VSGLRDTDERVGDAGETGHVAGAA